MEKPALSGRKSVRSCDPPVCKLRSKLSGRILTLWENTDAAGILQSLEHRTVRCFLLHMRQNLVLQSFLLFRFGLHSLRRLDIRTASFRRDDEFALQLDLGVGDDLGNDSRGVTGRFG